MWKKGKLAVLRPPLNPGESSPTKLLSVAPKTFPKKKHKESTYARSRVAIARKNIKISKTIWTANAFKTACVKQKKNSQLSSDKIIRNRMELEKLANSTSTAEVRKVSSKK